MHSQHEGTVPRRAPSVVRRTETICRSHPSSAHHVDGLPPFVVAAIAVVEHTSLFPGMVSRAFRQWEVLAYQALHHDPSYCGVPSCCGPGPRAILEAAIRGVPRRAKLPLLSKVRPIDEVYLLRTLPDLHAQAGHPWWEQRVPRR
jgi:hypothetical protein